MSKKILVTGAKGLVGSRFIELYKNQDNLLTPTLSNFNLLDPSLMERYIKKNSIDTIVNFAAFTDVGAAEGERGDKQGLCWRVNVEGVNNLIKLFDRITVHFIHISTDMVFPGSAEDPGPYSEDHKLKEDPVKLTWYGYTKGEGERILNDYFRKLAILRIIYPVRAKYDPKLDYLRKPLKLYKEGKLYPLFDDQQISITFIDEACGLIEKLITEKKTGIYHCCSSDTSTPYEIVKYLIEAKYRVKDAVKSISIYSFLKNIENPIRYPIFGGLNVKETMQRLNIKFSNCIEIVDKLVKQGITA